MRGEINGRNGNNGHKGYKREKSHPDRNTMVSYVTGSCSEETKKVIEEHCIDCLDCRTQLTVLLHLVISPEDRKEHRKFTELLTLGEEAAARARATMLQHKQPGHEQTSRVSKKGKKVRVVRTALAPVLLILTLLVGGLI
ncbi:MAG: hypothetical protein J2P31_16840, partial [Blastocatellia bacterium]|nr:hypothetical protein [Blastocatellia bacterium]